MAGNKLVFVIPSLRAGGMERVMVELADFITKQPKVDLSLISITKKDIFYNLPTGLAFHEPTFRINDHSKIISLIKTYLFVRKTVKTLNPDSLLSFGGKYNSFVLLASLFLGIDVYVSDRSRPGISYGKILDRLNPIVYKMATGIIAQTSQAKVYLEKTIGHRNITIIPNPVKRPRLKSLQENNVILNVGRFIESKQQDILVDIVVSIFPFYPDWKLIFVGDGPYLEKVKSKVALKGFQNKILFTGNVKNVSEYYNQASIFAFTSISEGFPNALLEASAHGLACISFDCQSGPAEIIEDEVSGYLIEEGNTNCYREKLSGLMNDKSLRKNFGENSYLKTRRYSTENIGRDYLNFMLTYSNNK